LNFLKIQRLQGQDRMNSMRPTRLTTIFSASAAFGLVLGTAMLAAPTAAYAADDDVPLDTKIIRGLMESLGLRRDGEGINYQERAPLVIPPSSDLPPPEKADAAVANNPAWPKDPDVARRKEEIRVERERRKVGAGDQVEHDQRVLRPNELTPGGNPRTPPSGRKIIGNLGVDGARMSPSELGYKGGLFSGMFGSKDDDEAARFTGEPPRVSLTDPPPGYQTPSPDQPYGAGKAPPPKATNYTASHGEMQR
jgi:hypothetical protein